MTALSTSPSAGFPAGLRNRAFDEQAITGAAKHAAGIMFVAPDGDVLLCRRSGDEKNYAGHWALPGGGGEDGETPDQTAEREAREELGDQVPTGARKTLDKRITPNGMAFHTFVQPVDSKFAPRLNSEHVGYAWAPLDQLPTPIHPSVEKTIKERVLGEDAVADWPGVRKGFADWTRQAEDQAFDSMFTLAFDESSVRDFDVEGRLRIKSAHISKATVNPYRGDEIPNWEELGLDRGKVYQLLRDPDELAKAASTFNGVQILRKHIPVSADDHQPWDIVGTTGTESKFNDPYLDNSLVIWTRNAIDAIEDESQRELSCAYHYRAEMTAGNFRGTRFDGVMRDIRGNHVALVEQGRAGHDVIVGDAALRPSENDNQQENHMKPTRLAKLALLASAAMIRPILAQDAGTVDLLPVFKGLTTKNFKAKQVTLALDSALKGKIAQDASLEQVTELLDSLEAASAKTPEASDKEVDEKGEQAMQAAASIEPTPVEDDGREGLSSFLKGKGMGEDDVKAACDMAYGSAEAAAKPPAAADEDDEEAKKKAAEEAAKKKGAEDMDKVSKPAMDAAIKAATEATAKTVRADVLKTQGEIRTAERAVQPYVGELPAGMAFDSGAAVFRHALKMLNVEGADKIHESALPMILSLQPKPGARPAHDEPIAMDEAAVSDFAKRYPNASRIGQA